MIRKKFYIGDILSLLYFGTTEEQCLFLDDERSEGIETLVAFMLGLGTGDDAYEYLEDDHWYSCALRVCMESLVCQFPGFTRRKFRNGMMAMKKRAKRSCLRDELEASWLTEQAKLYVAEQAKSNACQSDAGKKGPAFDRETVNDDDPAMLIVESVGYLYLPVGQERFELVDSFNLFNDRPMNTN